MPSLLSRVVDGGAQLDELAPSMPSSSCSMIPDLQIGGHFAVGQERGAVLVVQRPGEQVDGTVGQSGDELVELRRVVRREAGPVTKPMPDVSGLLMSVQSGPNHSNAGFEGAVDHRLGEASGTPGPS